MLSNAIRQQAADILMTAARERKQAVQLSKTWPDITIEDAYAISTEVANRRIAAGAKLIGHKVGLTSKAMQRSSQIDEPDYGHLLDDMMVADGARVAHENYCRPRVEIELAFVLGKSLKGPGVGLPDVLRATEYVVPAIEIVDARVQDPRKIFDTVADNGAAAGIVIGGRPVRPLDVDLRWVGGIMYCNSEIEETGVAAGVLGHPALGVAWLANKLGQHGVRSSPAIWSWPARSPGWCSPRRATRCMRISARSAALRCSSSEAAIWRSAPYRACRAGRLDRIRADPRAGEARDQHRQDADQEDAVEGSGPADRCHRGAEALHLVEIEEVGADQGAEAAADISERCGIAARQQQGDDRGGDRGHEYRLRDPEAGDRIGQHVAHQGDPQRGQQTRPPEPIFDEQIERHQAGYDGAADVHRDDRAGPLHHHRDGIAHAVVDDLAAGQDVLRRQFDDRDVEVAAHQRAQEQQDGGAGAQADAHIGVAQRAELNHHDQDDEYSRPAGRRRAG